MPKREITPVPTQRMGYDPATSANDPPPVGERLTTLTEAVETVLTTQPGDAKRTDALGRVRALLDRLRPQERA